MEKQTDFEWVVYYGNGSTYSSLDGSVWDTPPLDVQVIVLMNPWQTQAKEHFYVWDERGEGNRWYGCNEFGLWDYLMRPGKKKVIFGRTIARAEFGRILKRAQEETRWAHQ